VHSTCTLRY